MTVQVARRAARTWRLFRRLPSARARRAFLARGVSRGLFGRLERLPAITGQGMVLFVCHGNIMRSALGEVALRRALGAGSSIRVASAGTAATSGSRADPRAITYAQAVGLDLNSHGAIRLDRALAHEASMILALDRRIEAEILALNSELGERTVLLGGMTADTEFKGCDIPDPYSLPPEEVFNSFNQVIESVAALAARLGAQRISGS